MGFYFKKNWQDLYPWYCFWKAAFMSFLWEKNDKRSFYFKYITVRVEFSELVWTRKCLDSILSSLSPRSGLNIYTLSRSCDAPLLSYLLCSHRYQASKPSPPASPSSRIWPHIAPGARGRVVEGVSHWIQYTQCVLILQIAACEIHPTPRSWGSSHISQNENCPLVSAPHSSTLPFSPARQGTRSCEAFVAEAY